MRCGRHVQFRNQFRKLKYPHRAKKEKKSVIKTKKVIKLNLKNQKTRLRKKRTN